VTIVGGFDVHRQQITFDYVDTDTGRVRWGQIRPATRRHLRAWLSEHCPGGDGAFATEGCTGWRFVTEELAAAGAKPCLADPAETANLRGPKKRAKTDRADARLQRELLRQGRLPQSWIPPTQVLEVRTLGRLYCALTEERRAWQQRIHAQLFHQGCPPLTGLLTAAGRAALAEAELSPAGRQWVDTALRRIDSLTAEIDPLRRQLVGFARRQPGCQQLQRRHYGVGWLCAAIIWAELGDARRFRSSDQVVRFAGLDVTVYSSDGKRSPGHLSRQGSPELRWAAFEAAKCAARRGSPDYAYYHKLAATMAASGKRPTLAVERKLLRRCYHTLREMGEAALAPVAHQGVAA
jgi:transposase